MSNQAAIYIHIRVHVQNYILDNEIMVDVTEKVKVMAAEVEVVVAMVVMVAMVMEVMVVEVEVVMDQTYL
jgi:hypothetical protein